jgi:predicted alpha/beta-hydrolase family hydrolase
MVEKKISIPVGDGEHVAGLLSLPEEYGKSIRDGVIIAHGAGNDMHNPLLRHVAGGMAEAGYVVLRFNFPYRDQGKKSPDSQNVLVATWRSVFRFLSEQSGYDVDRIIAAGKSMGGRVASQMAARGELPAARLIYFGYPLHAPGKKDALRDAHLYAIKTPMLFFAGTRDTLCDLEELKHVLCKLDASWDLEVIEGGDHSFHLPRSYETSEQEIYDRILNKSLEWLSH